MRECIILRGTIVCALLGVLIAYSPLSPVGREALLLGIRMGITPSFLTPGGVYFSDGTLITPKKSHAAYRIKEALEPHWASHIYGVKKLETISGKILFSYIIGKPMKGLSIITTINRRIQSIIEKHFGKEKKGCVIVIGRKGRILGLYFSPPDGFNRAMFGLYEPGSVLKPHILSLALSRSIDLNTPINCTGSIKLHSKKGIVEVGDKLKGKYYSHGRINLHEALVYSCNVVFIMISQNLSTKEINQYFTRLGLNGQTLLDGIPLSKSNCIIPDNSPFTKAQFILGECQHLNPIMLLASYGLFQTGKVWRPRIIEAIVDVEAKEIYKSKAKTITSIERLGITRNAVKATADAMKAVLMGGTANRARIKGIAFYGKTGTPSSNQRKNNALFIGYTKDFLILVLVEEVTGSGGSIAAPLAKEILKDIYGD